MTSNEREEAVVEQVLFDLLEDDNEGDLEGVLSHYAPDAVLMSPTGPTVRGRKDIETHYRVLFEQFEFTELKAQIEETNVQGNLATVAGTNTGSIRPLDDTTNQRIHSKFLMEFRKKEGMWKISRLIWTPSENN